MKVWVVQVYYDYEGHELAGVYTTEQAAKNRAEELSCYGDSQPVYEIELDQSQGHWLNENPSKAS